MFFFQIRRFCFRKAYFLVSFSFLSGISPEMCWDWNDSLMWRIVLMRVFHMRVNLGRGKIAELALNIIQTILPFLLFNLLENEFSMVEMLNTSWKTSYYSIES